MNILVPRFNIIVCFISKTLRLGQFIFMLSKIYLGLLLSDCLKLFFVYFNIQYNMQTKIAPSVHLSMLLQEKFCSFTELFHPFKHRWHYPTLKKTFRGSLLLSSHREMALNAINIIFLMNNWVF